MQPRRDGSMTSEEFAWESREFLRKLAIGRVRAPCHHVKSVTALTASVTCQGTNKAHHGSLDMCGVCVTVASGCLTSDAQL